RRCTPTLRARSRRPSRRVASAAASAAPHATPKRRARRPKIPNASVAAACAAIVASAARRAASPWYASELRSRVVKAMLLFDIAVVLLLIVCNGLFAMTELAVVSSRRSRLESMAEEGRRGARIVLDMLREPTAFLSTVQIGITLVGVLAGAFGGAMLAEPFGAWLDRYAWIAPHGEAVALAIVVVVITYLSLVFGELVPKRVALSDPERIASIAAPAMQVLS